MTANKRAELLPIIAQLLDQVGTEAATETINAVGSPEARRVLASEVQTRMALRLLHAGDNRPQIRDRLMQVHGISKETAYARINAAIFRRGMVIAK
jgi:hypothetical protein